MKLADLRQHPTYHTMQRSFIAQLILTIESYKSAHILNILSYKLVRFTVQIVFRVHTCEDASWSHTTHALQEGIKNPLKRVPSLITKQGKCKDGALHMMISTHKQAQRFLVHICLVCRVKCKRIPKVCIFTMLACM
jgi:hypothetical protein